MTIEDMQEFVRIHIERLEGFASEDDTPEELCLHLYIQCKAVCATIEMSTNVQDIEKDKLN